MMPVVRFVRMLAVVSLVSVLAACTAGQGPSDSAGLGPSASVSTTPSSGPFASLATQAAAAQVILLSCIPRFTGDPRDWCDGARTEEMITELTSALKNDIKSRPDPARFAEVSAAVTDTERSAGLLKKECARRSDSSRFACTEAFDALMADWRRLQAAANW
jgi:hypothetical protein